ncbi:hypothetical protein A2313_01785 [Candidatus Roizmanbacteria bacterium RIFOXYB2_FULL_41_10]|uniref:NfeD-like C-terminal domain-containing protein n=1 Tax=Candidatus Roizmanbacteria bacterium RIFOXYA1_FULL_41_12 TaxID=1802082 RepID=A0A1F7K5Q7_9BACT|nr:MAG: hypothetical protein A2209_02840 [Candidatus Roizmanbacteria bacterium RIFOXYA1_FULL_41_12]OGK66665.1 MAG: hypothetical protein A2262_03430 [Candidatus Roizmanbacteria bacterium RIFOXYA2_FULL_41_8]OGK67521.1 MAG: hypothetical protein A2377_01590 [Candidatus Roizmanbacteria bacterium RIFOXYB1_FULL_41_27]OGK71177.1 MAG: hypothetical protein A2403_00320 [Candidatus Roizmanbacteria bacterium RIFOXYC1_FULL_41_16]OGK72055.1 MAG: hypothetical protein A2313_01785 [Candidatus Roizmanbacteria bac
MTENIWLMVLGLILIIFELLFGAISGFDIALIGLSLIMGGLVHYFGASWQLGIVVAIVIILAYFVYFRRVARKKLLITTQKIGIDSLLGKTAVVVEPINRLRAGKVLLDGEIWRAIAGESLKENSEVVVLKIEGVSLKVTKLKLP